MSMNGMSHTFLGSMDPTGANSVVLYATRPIEIMRWGWLTTDTALTGDLVLTASAEEADGTVLSPTGAAQGGTLSVLAASHGLINKGAYIDAESFTYGKPLTIVPGERFEVISDGIPTLGGGHVFIEYRELPFQSPSRPSAEPGATTTTTQLGNITRLTA